MKQGNPAHFDAKAVFSGTFTNSEVINQIVHNHPGMLNSKLSIVPSESSSGHAFRWEDDIVSHKY